MKDDEFSKLTTTVKQVAVDVKKEEERKAEIRELRKYFPWCERDKTFVAYVTDCPYPCYNCTFFWFGGEDREAHKRRIAEIMWNMEMLKKNLGGGKRKEDSGW